MNEPPGPARGSPEGILADLQAFGRSAARIVEHGIEAFLDPDDDLLRRAGRSVIIDVSEAVSRLPLELRDAHPEIPWDAIRATRNIVAHAYDRVNDEYVWEALRTGVPDLLASLLVDRGRGDDAD